MIYGMSLSRLNANPSDSNASVLESNLNCLSRTPQVHRDELLRSVHQPQLELLHYGDQNLAPSPLLTDLGSLVDGLDIRKDPYVLYLLNAGDEGASGLQKVFQTGRTYCRDQLRHLRQAALEAELELGSWASTLLIFLTVTKFRASKRDAPATKTTIEEQEVSFLLQKLDSLAIPSSILAEDLDFASASPKVCLLLEIMAKEMHDQTAAILFVKTRAAVALLFVLLTAHPRTKGILRAGMFIGTSSNQARKSRLGDWTSIGDQSTTLDDLRNGSKNLIIATSVLEEGIDITACNLVVCFESPVNLKSFVQRRGRARHEQSKFVIMFPEQSRDLLHDWQKMEEVMKGLYADAYREVQELQELESSEHGHRELCITATGYVIPPSELKLSHYFSMLSCCALYDCQPILFIYLNFFLVQSTPSMTILPGLGAFGMRQYVQRIFR